MVSIEIGEKPHHCNDLCNVARIGAIQSRAKDDQANRSLDTRWSIHGTRVGGALRTRWKRALVLAPPENRWHHNDVTGRVAATYL